MDCGEKEQAVFQFVLGKLVSGEFPAGTFPATETELGEKFGLSRYHVHRALDEFFRLGILVSRRKGGLSVVRELLDAEKRHFAGKNSNKVLVINNLPAQYKWSVVHVNEIFFSALTQGLAKTGLELVCEDIPVSAPWSETADAARRHVEKHSPRAVIVIKSGMFFEQFQEFFYLLHDKVFIYSRAGLPEGYPLLSTIGIANCLDGVAAAEMALAGGAGRVLFCCKSNHSRVMEWQMERRYGVQLGLLLHSRDGIVVVDYRNKGDFPLTEPQRTTVLIAQNDELAAELIDAGRRNGLEAGRDYKIIGFGDDPRFREYELTTLRPDLSRIGSVLADAVVQSCAVPGRPPVISRLIPSIPVRRKTL